MKDSKSQEKKKKKCRFLLIEADEDLVSAQKEGGRRHLVKLVYVHEGKKRSESRENETEASSLLCWFISRFSRIWLEVLDYLDEYYELEATERIFIFGDGASWIKKGLEIIPKRAFVLDRFPLEKYLQEGLRKDPSTLSRVRRAIERGDKEEVKVLLKNAQKATQEERGIEKLKTLRKYLFHNWEGIIAYQEYSHLSLGGSAAGHVSHILSARLSSRPMGWSQKGVDHMSYLRAMKANGYSAKAFYLRTHRQNLSPFTLSI